MEANRFRQRRRGGSGRRFLLSYPHRFWPILGNEQRPRPDRPVLRPPAEDRFEAPRRALALTIPREDRWSKHKMAGFLRALGATQCVASAAKAVGMSRQSAYKLRNRLKGEPFDIAWEAAFQHGYDALHQAALERALHGVEVPVFHNGEQIGSRRHFDERLTVYFLSRRNAMGAQRLGRYSAAAEFWSERWDRLLHRVEHGPVEWQDEAGMVHDDDQAAEQLRQRHALDEAEAGRRYGRFG